MLSAGGIYEVYFTMPVEFDISRSYMIKNAFPVTRAKIDAQMGLAGKYGVRTNLLLNTPLVNVGVDLNRNISELKRIAKLKSIYPDFRVKLMPNHGCAFGCPFISFHIYLKDIYSMTGLKSNTGRAVGGSYDRCIYEDISDLADFIRRPFIRRKT